MTTKHIRSTFRPGVTNQIVIKSGNRFKSHITSEPHTHTHLSREKRLHTLAQLFMPKGWCAATSHHPHPQTLFAPRRPKEEEKLRNTTRRRRGGCGQPEISGECLHTQSREDGCSQNGLISWLQGLFSWLWFSLCNSCASTGHSLSFSLSHSQPATSLSARKTCKLILQHASTHSDPTFKSYRRQTPEMRCIPFFLKTPCLRSRLCIPSWPGWICPCELGCCGPPVLWASVRADTVQWWRPETSSASCQTSAGVVWPSQLLKDKHVSLILQLLRCDNTHQMVVDIVNQSHRMVTTGSGSPNQFKNM